MTSLGELKSHKANTCWWCGSEANSAEHMIKSTDAKRIFAGKENGQPVIAVPVGSALNLPTRFFPVQGPNSKHIKFGPIFCQNCNNARSQSFDKSYDAFINYWFENQAKIRNEQKIDFRRVYGRYWSNETFNMGKYLLKHVGCRIADSGLEVPSFINEYLDGNNRSFPKVHIGFCIDPGYEYFCEELSKVTNEPHSIVSLSELESDVNRLFHGLAFQKIKPRYPTYISGSMHLGVLKIEWMVAFEDMANPFKYPFNSPTYRLKTQDSITRAEVQEIVARSASALQA